MAQEEEEEEDMGDFELEEVTASPLGASNANGKRSREDSQVAEDREDKRAKTEDDGEEDDEADDEDNLEFEEVA
jgi:hypothetical protein